jgi:hypothetical protein
MVLFLMKREKRYMGYAACGAVGIGTGTWAVLSSIPEG